MLVVLVGVAWSLAVVGVSWLEVEGENKGTHSWGIDVESRVEEVAEDIGV